MIRANAATLDLDRSDNAAEAWAWTCVPPSRVTSTVRKPCIARSLDRARRTRSTDETAERSLALIEQERPANTGQASLTRQLAAVVNADDAYQRASALRDADKAWLALRWVERGLELAKRQGRAKVRRGLAVRASIYRNLDQPERALEDARASVNLGLRLRGRQIRVHRLDRHVLLTPGSLRKRLPLPTTHLEPDTQNVYAMNAAGRAFWVRALATGEADFLERSERCFRWAAQLRPSKSARARLTELAHRYRGLRLNDKAADLEAFLAELSA